MYAAEDGIRPQPLEQARLESAPRSEYGEGASAPWINSKLCDIEGEPDKKKIRSFREIKNATAVEDRARNKFRWISRCKAADQEWVWHDRRTAEEEGN